MEELQHFLTSVESSSGDGNWVKLSSFLSLIRKNKTEEERKNTEDPKKHNVLRDLKKYQHDSVHEEQNDLITPLSALRYIFSHMDNLEIYHTWGKSILALICMENNADKEQKTCFTLYQTLINEPINHIHQEILILKNMFDEHPATLCDEFESLFTKTQWQQICWFEYHFQKSSWFQPQQTLIQQTEAKWEFFEMLKSVDVAGQFMLQDAQRCIQSRDLRKKNAAQQSDIILFGLLQHSATVMEAWIFDMIEKIYPGIYNSVLIVNHSCHNEQNLVDIYVEASAEIIPGNDLAHYIKSMIYENHKLATSNVIIFHPNTFRKVCGDGDISRFKIRNTIMMKQLDEYILQQTICAIEGPVLSVDPIKTPYCPKCFVLDLPKPLSLSQFEILNEWLIDVPASLQVLLTNFICHTSVARYDENLSDKEIFITSKLEKLYIVLDILLHIRNKKYSGVLQQAMSEELLLYHGSITQVFSVTSRAGITLSRSAAEHVLQHEAGADKTHYTTFMKHHPLDYATVTGEIRKYATIKKCHLILMLDNLVRLTFKCDPVPGENRVGQRCLLPITIQGLPRDAQEVSSWHDQTICDETPKCTCKQNVTLLPDDLNGKLLTLLPDEESAWKKFSRLSVWGCPDIWKQIGTSGQFKS